MFDTLLGTVRQTTDGPSISQVTAVNVLSAVLAVNQSARATTRTQANVSRTYDDRQNDRPTYKPQLTSSVGSLRLAPIK